MERDEVAFSAGVEAARADIARGRLIFRWIGHTGHWGHWIVMQLEERFGVAVDEGFGVCLVDTERWSFADGYNSVLADEVNRRHGNGAFESVFTDSRKQTEDALWTAKEAWRARHHNG